MNLEIDDKTLRDIEKYVKGFLDGVESCRKYIENFEHILDDYWLTYSENYDINFVECNNTYKVFIYWVDKNGQTDVSKYKELTIY